MHQDPLLVHHVRQSPAWVDQLQKTQQWHKTDHLISSRPHMFIVVFLLQIFGKNITNKEGSGHHVTSLNLVNIGSVNGLVPDSNKPLHKPILTNHQWGLLAIFLGQFHSKCWRYLPLIEFENYISDRLHPNLPASLWPQYYCSWWERLKVLMSTEND